MQSWHAVIPKAAEHDKWGIQSGIMHVCACREGCVFVRAVRKRDKLNPRLSLDGMAKALGITCWCCCTAPLLLQVNIEVDCRFVQDMLKGDECYELRLSLKEHKDEAFPFKDDD